MAEAAHLTVDERVLEICTGSGHQIAVFSHFTREVVTAELVNELRERAASFLSDLGIYMRYRPRRP
jgi:protein-L-isoaspartate O-methyltransferase